MGQAVLMRSFRVHVFVGIALFVGAAGCELIAGLEDHQLVASPDGSLDGADANSEASSGPSFTIADVPGLTLQQGASASIDITITRQNGFADAVNITLSGLPAGATTTPLLLTTGQSTGKLTIATTSATPQGTSHLSIDGATPDGKVSASANLDLIMRGVPGSLDTLYGTQGIFSNTTMTGEGIAVDKDGNVVVSGVVGHPPTQIAALRITSTGTLDTSFASGLLVTSGPTPSSGAGVFPLSTGNTLLAGEVAGGASLFRVTSTGAFDSTFSPDGGEGYFDPNGGLLFNEFAADSTGRLIVAGRSFNAHQEIYVQRRLAASGDLDPAFAPVTQIAGTTDAQMRRVLVQPDGKVLTLCFATDSAGTGFALNRFTDVGGIDTTFGVNGYVAPIANALGDPTSMALAADGSILALIGGQPGSLARFSASGVLDTTFGTNGVLSAPASSVVAVQPDGKLVVVGNSSATSSDGGTYFVTILWRYTATGNADTSFGNAGSVQTQIGVPAEGGSTVSGVALQADGRILVMSQTNVSTSTPELTVARYWP